MQPIDHYGHWNKIRKGKKPLCEREKIALQLIAQCARNGNTFLDAGCGNGSFLQDVQKRMPFLKLSGLDYSPSEVNEARKNGLKVSQSNFEEGIKLKSSSQDIVYAGELIEHLYNPDFFLSEVNRILKDGGHLILSTPNLCAWFNRILLPLGIQPLFIENSTKSKLVGAGIIGRLKKGSSPVGHIRIFTVQALYDLLHLNGFRVEILRGAIYDEGLPRSLWPIDAIFKIHPPLSSNLLISARKVREPSSYG